jgi:hypothetical protein
LEDVIGGFEEGLFMVVRPTAGAEERARDLIISWGQIQSVCSDNDVMGCYSDYTTALHVAEALLRHARSQAPSRRKAKRLPIQEWT